MPGDSSSVPAPPTSGGENQPPLPTTTAHHADLEDKAGDQSNFGFHRWPRQETLALLRIRSEMDSAFRAATAKGPLWDVVSGKLAELGYNRNGKKCKEKFENLYKYHKRIKEGGRTGKSETKLYRFFHQLEALEDDQSKPQILESSTSIITVPSTTVSANKTVNLSNITSFPDAEPSDMILSNSTSLGMEIGGKRKRKWTYFFKRLVKGVVEKQDELQKKFWEALEKREQDRFVREEAWRLQEIARINREREILAHERSIAAAKDAAVMYLLQKIAQQNPTPPQSAPPEPPQQQVASPIFLAQQPPPNLKTTKTNNNGEKMSSSRWPKEEIDALIRIRTSLDSKYQENGPKGPLWDEIAAEMRKVGHNRSAKRCKEKWENINKYFKKVKESNKTRSEDSKTCPYFYKLDALYDEKKKNRSHVVDHNLSSDQSALMPQNAAPLMVRPEQQWPPPQPKQDLIIEDDQNQEDEDEEEDEGGDHCQIVVNKPQT